MEKLAARKTVHRPNEFVSAGPTAAVAAEIQQADHLQNSCDVFAGSVTSANAKTSAGIKRAKSAETKQSATWPDDFRFAAQGIERGGRRRLFQTLLAAPDTRSRMTLEENLAEIELRRLAIRLFLCIGRTAPQSSKCKNNGFSAVFSSLCNPSLRATWAKAVKAPLLRLGIRWRGRNHVRSSRSRGNFTVESAIRGASPQHSRLVSGRASAMKLSTSGATQHTALARQARPRPHRSEM